MTDNAAVDDFDAPGFDVPDFELDCRDWVVDPPDHPGLDDDYSDAPVLASLSSAIVEDENFSCVTAVLTVGRLDADSPPAVAGEHGVATEILDVYAELDTARFVLPTPSGQLAVLAEFWVSGSASRCGDGEPARRIAALMRSFRWAA